MGAMTTDFIPAGIPHNKYPRPQLRRENWQNLNGIWSYAITKSEESPNEWDGSILVPFCAESALSGVQKAVQPTDVLWYKRTFTIDGYSASKQTILHFGAVDYSCRIYVNGKKAGVHFGGYTSFELNISPYVSVGENTIMVSVTDKTDTADFPRGKQVLKPDFIWYTAVTGIWQTVWLEQVDENYIHSMRITPSLDRIVIHPECSGVGNIILEIYDGEDIVYASTIPVDTEETIVLDSPKLWTPETPFLYTIVATMTHKGRMTDRVQSYFGLRTFGMTKDKNGYARITLNGKPYFQRGLLDQGYWPDGLYTAPTDEAMKSDIETAKRLGFNMLRKHIKVEPARWYYYCDKIGILVWQDMPSGGAYIGNTLGVTLPNIGIHVKDNNYKRFNRENEAGRNALINELRSIIDQLYTTVCICTWVPFNEGWGQFNASETAFLVRSLDSTRLVDHASGWHDQGGGNMISVHRYMLPVFAPKKSGERAFVLSEYGGYSTPSAGHMWKESDSFGYRAFKTKEAISTAYKQLHEKQVIPLIKKGLCATVYTQLTDVETEINGILTYDRKMCKIDKNIIREINKKLKY